MGTYNNILIEKKHSSFLTEVFTNAESYKQHENDSNKYQNEWFNIVSAVSDLPIRNNKFSTFCPETQFLTIDALNKEDWPNMIAENSIYITLKINMKANTIEVFSCGHIWLSNADQNKTYLAMCSLKRAFKATGRKWFCKQGYKDSKQLSAKIHAFWKEVITGLNSFTGGYPYKQMAINIY